MYARPGSTVAAVVAWTALHRESFEPHAIHLPPQQQHLRGQHGCQDTCREEKHVASTCAVERGDGAGIVRPAERKWVDEGEKSADALFLLILASSAFARLTTTASLPRGELGARTAWHLAPSRTLHFRHRPSPSLVGRVRRSRADLFAQTRGQVRPGNIAHPHRQWHPQRYAYALLWCVYDNKASANTQSCSFPSLSVFQRMAGKVR